jgi:hypothetical protein
MYNQQPIPPPKLQPQQFVRDESLAKWKCLDEINSSIGNISKYLIKFFDELSRDNIKTVSNTKTKVYKQLLEDFLKHLKKIESDLLAEINHLSMASTGHPHEGSIYGARKDYDLARMRLDLIITQFNLLGKSLNSPEILEQNQNDTDSSDDDSDNEEKGK